MFKFIFVFVSYIVSVFSVIDSLLGNNSYRDSIYDKYYYEQPDDFWGRSRVESAYNFARFGRYFQDQIKLKL